MSDTSRELYPEEKILVRFLIDECHLKIYDHDIPWDSQNPQAFDSVMQERVSKLFGEMETKGVRSELEKLQHEMVDMRNRVRNFAREIPIDELLTSDDPVMRELGEEFKEIFDYHMKNDPDLPREFTTAKEMYDYYQEQKAQKAV